MAWKELGDTHDGSEEADERGGRRDRPEDSLAPLHQLNFALRAALERASDGFESQVRVDSRAPAPGFEACADDATDVPLGAVDRRGGAPSMSPQKERKISATNASDCFRDLRNAMMRSLATSMEAVDMSASAPTMSRAKSPIWDHRSDSVNCMAITLRAGRQMKNY